MPNLLGGVIADVRSENEELIILDWLKKFVMSLPTLLNSMNIFSTLSENIDTLICKIVLKMLVITYIW